MQVLKEEIRNRILVVAENIFYQNGFKETTTRSIANEAGISVSNLYLYYENKEAIFEGIIDEFYNCFQNSFETFLKHHDNDSKIEAEISSFIKKTIIVNQRKFVIAANKSHGTKYEGFKQQITRDLVNHMILYVDKSLVQDELIIYILAKNFIEGIIEIADNFKSECWLENSINTLVKYHFNGMKHLK